MKLPKNKLVIESTRSMSTDTGTVEKANTSGQMYGWRTAQRNSNTYEPYCQRSNRGPARRLSGWRHLPCKPDNLNSIPRTQVKVEEGNWLQSVFWPPHRHHGTSISPIYTKISFQNVFKRNSQFSYFNLKRKYWKCPKAPAENLALEKKDLFFSRQRD